MKYTEFIVPVLLMVISVAGFGAFALVATARPLTGLESVFLQAFSALAGFGGTFLIGRMSARSAAAEVIKPHARSAVRRLLSHFQSLHRMSTITASTLNSNKTSQYKEALVKVHEIAITQIGTADDAMADWEDIVPEDIKELRRALSSRQQRRGKK